MANLAAHTLRYGLAHPDAPAQFVRRDGAWVSISHAALARRVASLASWLGQQGIGDGDRVAIIAPTSPEWIWADLAILSCGAVVVPIYPSLPAPAIGEVMADAGARFAILADAEQEAKLPPGFPRLVMSYPRWQQVTMRPDLAPLDAFVSDLDRLPGSHLATLVYTSGTTAHSRGVMLTHDNLLSNIAGLTTLQANSPDVALGERDRALSVLPLAHIFERLVHHYMLGMGVAVYYTTPEQLASDIATVRPTVMVSVPRIYERVYRAVTQAANGPLSRPVFRASVPHAQRRANRLASSQAASWGDRLRDRWFDVLVYRRIRHALGGSLRFAYSGGAPLHPDLAQFFLGVGIPILEGYGLTETSPVVAVNTLATLKIGTVGRPLPGVSVRIADDGEIWCQGPNVMAGYWNRPEESREVLVDGWLHTGDIGELLPSGHLRILDRKRAILVLSTGKNVVPLSVTQALEASPWISQAMLVGDRRKFVAALIVPDFDQLAEWAASVHLEQLDAAQLLRHPACQALFERELVTRTAHLAPWEQPKRWTLLAQPFTEENGELTPTLKIKTRVVEQHYRDLIEQLYPDDPLPTSKA